MGKKFVLDQEDSTAAGGNPRGNQSVDLQMSRSNANEIAGNTQAVVLGGSGNKATAVQSVVVGGQNNSAGALQSFIGGGNLNTTSGGTESTIVGGTLNNMTGTYGFIGGGLQNTVSSTHSVVSGGQGNTASTNTHATVVGGQSNTASGPRAIVLGGGSNTSSGTDSIAGVNGSIASGTWAIALGYQNLSNATASFSSGREAYAIGAGAIAMGNGNPVALNTNAIAIGSSSRAEQVNSVALGGGSVSSMYNQFSILGAGGVGQASDLKSYRIASLLTGGTTMLSLDGSGVSYFIVPSSNNQAYNVQVNWVAVVTAITGTATGISVGDVITSVDLLGFKRVGGTSSASAHTSAATKLMVTTPAAYAACAINYTAGASQEMLLTFTGPTFVGGGSVTMSIVAKVEITQVLWT